MTAAPTARSSVPGRRARAAARADVVRTPAFSELRFIATHTISSALSLSLTEAPATYLRTNSSDGTRPVD